MKATLLFGALLLCAAAPVLYAQRGTAMVEETRPAHFPHRIWAACDFEVRTPDYAWFGPAEINNILTYPGNVTALGVKVPRRRHCVGALAHVSHGRSSDAALSRGRCDGAK